MVNRSISLFSILIQISLQTFWIYGTLWSYKFRHNCSGRVGLSINYICVIMVVWGKETWQPYLFLRKRTAVVKYSVVGFSLR